MNKLNLQIKCPACGLDATAQLKRHKKFIIFVCPGCQNNIVCYQDRIDIISDKLVKKLLRKGALVSCGDVMFKNPLYEETPERGPISKDDILNLKILLETVDLETEDGWEELFEKL